MTTRESPSSFYVGLRKLSELMRLCSSVMSHQLTGIDGHSNQQWVASMLQYFLMCRISYSEEWTARSRVVRTDAVMQVSGRTGRSVVTSALDMAVLASTGSIREDVVMLVGSITTES